MDRRALGALLLVMTAVLALVVPGILGTRITGTPAATYVPAPPAVGMCVVQDPDTSPTGSGQVAGLSYGSCDKPHYGEVVQVYADSRTFPRLRLDQTNTPDPSVCNLTISSYLGSIQVVARDDRGDYRSVQFGSWEPVSIGTVGLLGPSGTQQAVGQHWIACVTQGARSQAVVGTVRDAFVGGVLPDSYSVCLNDLTSTDYVDCLKPHRAELFATTPVSTNLPAQDRLDRSCSDFVRYLTGLDDAAAGGRLSVAAIPVYYGITGHPNPSQTNPVQTQPARAFCGVITSGGRTLNASIFGLRDKPLPLS
ncbi:hypothetical protein ABIB25_003874 [Nakamurella sp. UYEF19]|uniref:hypothetical protein n=1 Tax=Nakamurella sp. UYEF19 TaxID=1756392 RepID=UPI003395BC92